MNNIIRRIIWEKKYYTKKIVDFSKYLNQQDLDILKKFGIEIKDQIYTEYEFDLVDEVIFLYYREPGEKNEKYNIEDIGVSQDEYDRILEKFIQISKEYDF
ncbi:MAG: hypothetical protein IJW20_07410 [Clostridia bacterium]|nr:hypothetical protein [Clostridia bacterium]